jgi:hypothetical protein
MLAVVNWEEAPERYAGRMIPFILTQADDRGFPFFNKVVGTLRKDREDGLSIEHLCWGKLIDLHTGRQGNWAEVCLATINTAGNIESIKVVRESTGENMLLENAREDGLYEVFPTLKPEGSEN